LEGFEIRIGRLEFEVCIGDISELDDRRFGYVNVSISKYLHEALQFDYLYTYTTIKITFLWRTILEINSNLILCKLDCIT